MERTSLKLGQYVIAQNSIIYQEGTIDKIEESTGSRKGLIYKVGANWFFADEIKIDLEGILFAFIKKRGLIELQEPRIINRNYKGDLFTFTYDHTKYKLQGMFCSDHFVYVVANDPTGKSMFLCTRHLPNKTVQRIFDFVETIYGEYPYWKEVNIK